MQQTMKKLIYKDAFRYIWIPICLSIFQVCLEGVMSVRYASIFGDFADAVFLMDFSEGLKNLYSFLVALLVTVFLIPTVAFVNDVILVKNAFAHDRRVLSRFLDKTCDAVDQVEAGDMLNRLDDDPNELRLELIYISSAVFMIPVTAGYLIFNVLQISLLYFLIVLGISLVKFIIPLVIKKAEKKYHMKEKEYASAVRACETDISDRAYLINLLGIRKPFVARLDKQYDVFFKDTKKKSIRLNAVIENVKSLVDTFCMMIILLIGAYLVATNKISPGAVAAMMGYYSVLNMIISKFDYIIRRVPILNNLAERLEYFYEGCEANEGRTVAEFDMLQGEKLTFSYENKVVLSSVSFSIKKGDKVVICGTNGSGKSTILKIMLGMLTEYQGELAVNGIRFSEVNMEVYRSLIAYAPQDPYLFKGTVFENIQLASLDGDEAEIKRWMQEYGILSIAEREISGGGYELSGGERQKISIIRAMIKGSPVVFIDEPENNLDNAAVIKMKKWLQASDKTIVYVSHHPDLVACADMRINLS